MSNTRSTEHGAALVISLLILLVLTLVGAAAINMSASDERMAGNTQDHYHALQQAEVALRDGEEMVRGLDRAANFSGSGKVAGGYRPQDCSPVCWQDQSVTWLTAVDADGSPVPEQSYIIESLDRTALDLDCSLKLPPDPNCYVYWYRVTARGRGKLPSTESTLQANVKFAK